MIDRKSFFDSVRKSPFSGKLSTGQVSGMEAILAEWERRKLTDLRQLAYMLSTTFHETGPASKPKHMQPIHELGGSAYFKKMYDIQGSRPSVARTLGNTIPGDGVKFHGRGYVQLTGRANYQRASTKLGIDFVANPDRVLEPALAAAIMFTGMSEGWFTGKKLFDYFNAKTDWVNARRIINGTDKAHEIASYARAFHAALLAAHGSQVAAPVPPPPDIPSPVPHPNEPDLPDEAETIQPTEYLIGFGVIAAIVVGVFVAVKFIF